MNAIILNADARRLPLSNESVQCVVTSPPYFGLRSYLKDNDPKKAREIGLEASLDAYIANLVEVFREVWRVLKPEGTLWLNLGDSYNGSGGAGGDYGPGGLREGQPRYPGRRVSGLKPKDLIGVPWRVALALQSDGADIHALKVIDKVRSRILEAYKGEIIPDKALAVLEDLEKEYENAKGKSWWLRSEIIWNKPNSMPESVDDRPTVAHEHIFLFAKSGKPLLYRARDTREWSYHPDLSETIVVNGNEIRRWRPFSYYYNSDAIREPLKESSIQRGRYGWRGGSGDEKVVGKRAGGSFQKLIRDELRMADLYNLRGANKRSVWTVATQPYKGAHFATFPEKLVEPMILAGSKPGDIVLDPFAGSGTTGVVALRYHRRFIGVELNQDYIRLAQERLSRVQPVLLMETPAFVSNNAPDDGQLSLF